MLGFCFYEVEDGNKVKKLFGDIFEAMCGAVLVDLYFNIEKFKKYIVPFIAVLEECADVTR